ncbi:MAG TPA: hypothetical protein VFP46_02120, partial [Candidatus Paceibacterota bacterium]|nr:hypothetical protein [Candidatus Paceibacterota bacterium]
MKYPHIRLVVLLLGLALIAPVSLFVVPESAHAIPVEVSVDPFEVADTIQNTITAVATPVSAAANLAKQISDYVLQPIAFIKSGMLLKTLTAGVVSFVTGATNGTGAPQFVQNLQGNLQRVGDTQALAFFAQFASNSNSPFSSSIVSALRMNYLQQTSAAGFWAANRSTLSRYSPNVNSFLAGNWSQGGVGAWLALTTQPQNNPYLMYQMSQGQLGTMVAGAVNARQSQLAWGQGFLSWCGPAAEVEGPPAGACTPQSNDGDGCTTDAGVPGTCSISPENPQNVQCVPKVGVNPGDSCYQSDGTPGQIRTPGSVIAASLNKALGGGQDKLVQMGNIGTQLGKILSDIATIMGTINLANDILSGPSFDGLAGASRSPAFSSTNNPANTAI